MAKDIVIRGGDITAKEFAKKSDEHTTQDVLTDLSVFLGKVDAIDQKHLHEIEEFAKGYSGKNLWVTYKKNFPSKAKFKRDTSPSKPYHYLLSGITIEEALAIFKHNSKGFNI